MLEDYAPGIEGVPDSVGAERYPGLARMVGTELDLTDTYMWGWSEYHRITAIWRSRPNRCCRGPPSAKR